MPYYPDTDYFCQALDLQKIGYSVIPSGSIRPPPPLGKKPLISWTEFQSRIATKDELYAWYNQFHPRIWGLVTGAISKVVVFDADGEGSINAMHQVGLLPHVMTKRGEHFYFKHPGHLLKNSAKKLMPDLDFRGDGGFVNFTGKNQYAEYAIVVMPAPDTLYDLRQLPEPVKKALYQQAVTPKAAVIDSFITDGQRNDTLASLAGSMRHRGMSQPAIEQALLTENNTRCRPPLDEAEVLSIAKSIARYNPEAPKKPQIRGAI